MNEAGRHALLQAQSVHQAEKYVIADVGAGGLRDFAGDAGLLQGVVDGLDR